MAVTPRGAKGCCLLTDFSSPPRGRIWSPYATQGPGLKNSRALNAAGCYSWLKTMSSPAGSPRRVLIDLAPETSRLHRMQQARARLARFGRISEVGPVTPQGVKNSAILKARAFRIGQFLRPGPPNPSKSARFNARPWRKCKDLGWIKAQALQFNGLTGGAPPRPWL